MGATAVAEPQYIKKTRMLYPECRDTILPYRSKEVIIPVGDGVRHDQ